MSSHLARSIFELIALYTPFLKHQAALGAQFNLKVICTVHGILLSSLIMIIISFGTLETTANNVQHRTPNVKRQTLRYSFSKSNVLNITEYPRVKKNASAPSYIPFLPCYTFNYLVTYYEEIIIYNFYKHFYIYLLKRPNPEQGFFLLFSFVHNLEMFNWLS